MDAIVDPRALLGAQREYQWPCIAVPERHLRRTARLEQAVAAICASAYLDDRIESVVSTQLLQEHRMNAHFLHMDAKVHPVGHCADPMSPQTSLTQLYASPTVATTTMQGCNRCSRQERLGLMGNPWCQLLTL